MLAPWGRRRKGLQAVAEGCAQGRESAQKWLEWTLYQVVMFYIIILFLSFPHHHLSKWQSRDLNSDLCESEAYAVSMSFFWELEGGPSWWQDQCNWEEVGPEGPVVGSGMPQSCGWGRAVSWLNMVLLWHCGKEVIRGHFPHMQYWAKLGRKDRILVSRGCLTVKPAQAGLKDRERRE